ncbi:MAG: Coniferyl aldehyde dehydrogenase [Candidatus Accumulibacter appositus]|uniref:Aldehyde dehydrogenase n=1 Tax=Candidatus Accumulibacter appositus TaxID=1454003 RepID=A0A011PZ98_9PROT|nr:coniferyl aldehyde dehydrogenase [Accumulibacter sp.]EXI82292.1 MAG: Coniferyl aldehyde dehydrogenase [Candidatus Accumulibacter appositus]HRF06066.1 coniferyl aldehyde dehydrogenase [Accumulibacter sp.]
MSHPETVAERLAASNVEPLAARFALLQRAARGDPNPQHALRERRLLALDRMLRDSAVAIVEAVSRDFGHRSPAETRLLELFPSYEAIRHARRHLRRWMRPQRRAVSLWFQPGRAEVRYQPLGAVGIIVPWNYPVLLAIAPLAAALAAGNRALLKMSEMSPNTAALFATLVARTFAADEVSVVEGDASVAQAFSRLPFDHLLFTGSTAVGHQVMRAAADNLTPVTLELGGKSPAIIGPGLAGSKDFARAVERILIGKCMNAGQTCIAPDYVLLPAGDEQAFIERARAVVASAYPRLATNGDYSTIIDARHYARLCAYVDEARASGAEIVELAPGAAADPAIRRLPPLALLKVNDQQAVMQEEIFGPLLPIRTYRHLDDAIAFVSSRPRPLALYYFDSDSERIERVLDETLAGGVTINDTILHIAQDDLPFGGVGPSGMGRYHGFEGFETFSAKKGVFRQSRLSAIGLFKPPYGRLFRLLTRIIMR